MRLHHDKSSYKIFNESHWLTTALTASALFSRAVLSDSSNGSTIVETMPCLPNTAGRLRQQPRSSCQWLTGRTWCASKRIDSQVEETTAPIPNAVAPLAAMMEYALSRVAVAMLGNDEGGTRDANGAPPTVAEDHATLFNTRASVCPVTRKEKIQDLRIGCRHVRPRRS
jgi:hypothetical protein